MLIFPLIFELGFPFSYFKLYHFPHITFCAKSFMSYLMKQKEKYKEGKNNFRWDPVIILFFHSLPNPYTGSCNPGHTALLS